MEKDKELSTEYVPEIVNVEEYTADFSLLFPNVSAVMNPLISRAKDGLIRIEQMLYRTPAFIESIKAMMPSEAFQAILTDEQKAEIASGAIKIMTKKDGSLMANLVNTKTNKIVSTISLESVKLTPELGRAITSFSSQMQMAQIAEQIRDVQLAIEEVRQGQENDRLAAAYSCQQKFLQAMSIQNLQLRRDALMRIAFDAEDSRNLLMLSQQSTATFIRNQPQSIIGKMLLGEKQKKVDERLNELRDGLNAVNMVSLVEAMVYNELGEPDAAKKSLLFYSDFLDHTYLSYDGFTQRLDSIDASPKEYWSKILPRIKKRIEKLPECTLNTLLLGESSDEE